MELVGKKLPCYDSCSLGAPKETDEELEYRKKRKENTHNTYVEHLPCQEGEDCIICNQYLNC